jgi:hypothetical protein
MRAIEAFDITVGFPGKGTAKDSIFSELIPCAFYATKLPYIFIEKNRRGILPQMRKCILVYQLPEGKS